MEERARDLTLNAGLRYDLQFLETIDTDTTTSRRASGSPGRRSRRGDTVVRGSAGLFYDRVPLRALANALLSAGNTTDLANLRQISVSLSPTQAGAPVFPNILSAVVPTVTLVNLTTMDPGHAERVFHGRRASRSSGSSAIATRSASATSTSAAAI